MDIQLEVDQYKTTNMDFCEEAHAAFSENILRIEREEHMVGQVPDLYSDPSQNTFKKMRIRHNRMD